MRNLACKQQLIICKKKKRKCHQLYRSSQGLFGFPRSGYRREKWLSQCQKTSVRPTDRICFKHFEDRCFIPRGPSNKFRLLVDSIPTLKLPLTANCDMFKMGKKRKKRVCILCPHRGTTGFFQFPKNPIIRQEWLKICQKDSVADHDKICLNHFETSAFESMTDDFKRQRLVPSAIPTKNLPSAQNSNVSSEHKYSIPEGNVKKEPLKKATQTDLKAQKLTKDVSTVHERIEFLQRKVNALEKQSTSKVTRDRAAKAAFSDRFSSAQYDVMLNVSNQSIIYLRLYPREQFFCDKYKFKQLNMAPMK